MFGFFRRGSNSKDVARDRLKLVLVHDRANVSPQLLEMLKSDIMKVISNYMEIQNDELEIQITRTESDDGKSMVPALIANIPIKKMRSID